MRHTMANTIPAQAKITQMVVRAGRTPTIFFLATPPAVGKENDSNHFVRTGSQYSFFMDRFRAIFVLAPECRDIALATQMCVCRQKPERKQRGRSQPHPHQLLCAQRRKPAAADVNARRNTILERGLGETRRPSQPSQVTNEDKLQRDKQETPEKNRGDARRALNSEDR